MKNDGLSIAGVLTVIVLLLAFTFNYNKNDEYDLAKTPEYKKLHPSVETLAKERIDYYLKEEGYKNSIVERIKIISNFNNEKFKLSITIKDEKNYKKNHLEIEGFITFDSYKFPKDYGDNFYINIPKYAIKNWYYKLD